MGKAILVIDNPDGCSKCKLQVGGEYCDIHCAATNKVIPISCNKPKWCPLKEVPEKADIKKAKTMTTLTWCEGWNTCIDEILKEQN